MVSMKEFFDNVNFEKYQQRTKAHSQLPSSQRNIVQRLKQWAIITQRGSISLCIQRHINKKRVTEIANRIEQLYDIAMDMDKSRN